MAMQVDFEVHSGAAGGVLAVGGEEFSAEWRSLLREQQRAGELSELEFDALVWRDGPNGNHFRFREQDLAGFGASFAGQPFLRDHDVHHIASRDGTIGASRLDAEQGGFVQRVRLTTERGIEDFVQGRIDRFSIGWYFDAVTCSVCEQDWLSSACTHWPGRKYERRNSAGKAEQVLCELIFENPRGKETSAVNAPAVAGTGILSQLCELKANLEKEGRSMDGEETVAGAGTDINGGAQPAAAAALDVAPGAQPASVPGVTAPAAAEALEWASFIREQAIDQALAASGLPAEAQEVVRAMVGEAGDPAALQTAIAAQKAVVAKAQQVVTGMPAADGGRVGGMMTSVERVGIALEALITGQPPAKGVRPLSGIREAYVLLSGDYDMRGLFVPENVGLANVNSTTMAGIVANVLNKVVVNVFQQYPRWWEPIVTLEQFTTLQAVKWITMGGVGELPTVAEGTPYTEMTWDDQTETANWVKKGGYLGLTLESIDRDDTRRIQMAPRALAQAAYLSLSRAVSSIFTANSGVGPTMSDGVALFHANHNNLGTTALSYSAWTATRAAMRKQTELNSGERLGGIVVPKYLLAPPDLEGTALTVLLSEGQAGTGNNDENPWADGDTRNARLAAARNKVIVVDLWTDTNNWAAVADPMLYPSIGLGFRFGPTPEVFSVATPNSGLMFTNDVMPVKVRFFFAVGPTDWRGMYKQNVA